MKLLEKSFGRRLIGAVFTVSVVNGVCAGDQASAGLLEQSLSRWFGLGRHAVGIGGWAAGGINYNANNPADRSNGPVSMSDRDGEFHLYQLNLFIDKALDKSGNWDWGGRFDFMYGTDSRYAQATGHWDNSLIAGSEARFYDIALPQAYLEVYAPFGNGLNAKFGHFYGIVGYEAVPATLNFFASHSYSFKSSPFTVTGALFDYPLGDEWTLSLGAVTGADNFDRDLGAWSQLSGLTWNHADSGTTLSFSLLQGDVYQKQASDLFYCSAIWQQSIGDFQYVLQHDRGTQEQAAAGYQEAEWYSLVHYLHYRLNEAWRLGVRGEWFRDHDGVRYGNGSANYYALTGGVNWRANHWLMLRPEVRYDWAQSAVAAFDAGGRNSQFLFSIDAVLRF